MAGTVIEGTVQTSSGDPVVEARVYFTEAPVPISDIAALTNEKGGFSLYAPAPGRYTIECLAEGFEKAVHVVDVTGKEPRLELVIALER